MAHTEKWGRTFSYQLEDMLQSLRRVLLMIRKVIRRVPGARQLAVVLGMSNRHFLLRMLPRDSIGAEIGVNKGDFSSQILRTVKPRELHLIDPWKHEESGAYEKALYGGELQGGQKEMDYRYRDVCRRFGRHIQSGRVIVHRGHSSDILKRFQDQYFDWIYIDGNHRYEFVVQDLELSFRKTRVGGYISGDDYGRKSTWWDDGVERAVNEFIEREPVQVIKIQNFQFIVQR